jgi:hypothetical protein
MPAVILLDAHVLLWLATRLPGAIGRAPLIRSDYQKAIAVTAASTPAAVPLDLTDFKRDLSELTDRLGHAQDCL